MNVCCIFCGTVFDSGSASHDQEMTLTCPSCKGSFVVGKGGTPPEGITPILPALEKAKKPRVALDLTKYYFPVGIGLIAIFVVGLSVYFISNRSKKPSITPTPVSRALVQEKKIVYTRGSDDYYKRGVEYYKNQNYSASVGEFQRSLKINPDNIAAFVYIGGAFVKMKKYSEAIPYLEKGKNLPLYKKYVFTNLGAAYEALDLYKDAANAYSSLSSVDPQSSFAYKRLGHCYSRIGDYKNAKKALEEVLKINPKDQWAQTQLAFVNKQLNKR